MASGGTSQDKSERTKNVYFYIDPAEVENNVGKIFPKYLHKIAQLEVSDID